MVTAPIIRQPLPSGGIENVADLDSDQTDPITDTVENPLIDTVDPVVTKSGDPHEAQIGDIVTFTLEVTNQGVANATGVQVIDSIFPFLDILSVETTKGTVTILESTVFVNIGTLAPGEVVIITILTRVNDQATPPTEVVNQTQIVYNEGPEEPSLPVIIYIPPEGVPTPTSLVPTPVPTSTPIPVPTESATPIPPTITPVTPVPPTATPTPGGGDGEGETPTPPAPQPTNTPAPLQPTPAPVAVPTPPVLLPETGLLPGWFDCLIVLPWISLTAILILALIRRKLGKGE